MTSDRLPHEERDEPPVVLGMFMRATAGVAQGVRRIVSSIHPRVQIVLWAAGTVGVFLAIVSLSIAQTPGWEGVVGGVFGGGFTALLFAAAGGWLLLWARGAGSTPRDDTDPRAEALNALLAPTLRELNAVRADVSRQVKVRSITRVPLGILGAILLWMIVQWSDDPPGFFELLLFLAIGAGAGEWWAFAALDREYQRLYKARVLPVLAARFGNLTYQPARDGEVQRLSAFRILPEFDSVHADDEIAGTHRGLPIRIIEARLRKRSGEESRDVFDGLLIEIGLPRRLTGTTVLVADAGPLGNLKTRWHATMEPVRLEDPRFEQRFEVYGTDQIEARALLTPSFMERFVALAGQSGFALPGAVAEGNRLVVALPKTMGVGNLFEPPPYWKPAGGRALVALERDIGAVLHMAESVAALDFWAAGRLGPTPR